MKCLENDYSLSVDLALAYYFVLFLLAL